MPTLVNLTGNIADLVGTDFDARRTKVWVTTNLPGDVLIDATGNEVRLGDAYATVTDAGLFTFTGLWATNSATNPTAFQYQLHVDYPKRSADRGRNVWDSGWFDLTATADIADVVQGQYVPPTWMTTATGTLQGYVDEGRVLRDEQIDISNISTSDGVVEALVKNTGGAGPLTSAALSATYGRRRGNPTDFSYLMAALDNGAESVAWQVNADSTSNGTDEWVYLTTQWLAGEFPAYTVDYLPWNATTDNYDPMQRIQTGPNGERYGTYASGSQSYELDTAGNSIAGDLDVRAKIAPNNWSLAAEQTIAAKFIGAGVRSWRFMLNSSILQFDWSEDGTNLKGPKSSGVVTLPVNGTPGWVRVTLDVDNGAAGNDVKFYTSTDGVTWTQVGTTVTTAGVTSIFNSTAELQLGARGGASAPGSNLLGKIYRVEIRNGIDGALVAPALPEAWSRHGSVTFSGSPVFTVVNGSHGGADIFVLTDATRFAKMTPNYGQALCTMSCSHNDTNRTGSLYLADRTTLLTLLRDKFPQAGVTISTQNPRISPAAYITEHAVRQSQLIGWANRQRVGVIDAYRAFLDDGRPLTDLVYNPDGIHTLAAGSQVWADEAISILKGR